MRNLLISLIVTVSVVATGLPSFAQGDSPDCHLCIGAKDVVCSNVTCATIDDCESTTFSVACEADYFLDVHMTCPSSSDCQYCQACAKVYLNVNQIGSSNHTACPTSCDRSNGNLFLHLIPGNRYTLYACKVPCPGLNYTCADCPTSCVAEARVIYPGSLCQPW